MIPELGHFALILSLCVAIVLGTLPLIGAHRGQREWLVLARPAAQAMFLLVAVAMAALTWSFYVNDFSVAYVAGHSNSLLPTQYRIAAVWGGHEGSLLLWVFMLAGWTVAVAQRSRSLDEAMVARVLGVLGLVTVGLLLFVLLTSNPFARIATPPMEGRDLNPILQDPGLAIHPPLLYLGYVGFSISFSFAVAALIEGRMDDDGRTSVVLEEIHTALKTTLDRSLPVGSLERRSVLRRMKQLKLIDFRSDDDLDQPDTFIVIRPLITSFVHADLIQAAGEDVPATLGADRDQAGEGDNDVHG